MKKKYTKSFEKIWSIWPRKEAKYAAFLKFLQLEKKEPKEIRNLEQWMFRVRDTQQREFIPYLKTVLNQRRWEDDVMDLSTPVDRGVDKSKKDWQAIKSFILKKGRTEPRELFLSQRGHNIVEKMGGFARLSTIQKHQIDLLEVEFRYRYNRVEKKS
jgi:hypothetical protein